jgi:hypothetical protein
MEMGGVMARRKVSMSAQIIFNNQQRLVVALEGSGGVAQIGGDDDRWPRRTWHVVPERWTTSFTSEDKEIEAQRSSEASHTLML